MGLAACPQCHCKQQQQQGLEHSFLCRLAHNIHSCCRACTKPLLDLLKAFVCGKSNSNKQCQDTRISSSDDDAHNPPRGTRLLSHCTVLGIVATIAWHIYLGHNPLEHPAKLPQPALKAIIIYQP